MDDLSKNLNVNAGCIIGAALINHLMYADDLVLLDLVLLSVSSDYGLEHDIKYNSTKSNVMIYCCKMQYSGNAILQSIMTSDALYTSPLCHHWRNMLYIYSF